MNVGEQDQARAAIRDLALAAAYVIAEMKRAGFTKKEAREIGLLWIERVLTPPTEPLR